jgi:hypothetical protein
MEHVPSDVFGADYLYFYEEWLDDELSSAQADLIWETLALREGDEVLDVRVGTGGSRTGWRYEGHASRASTPTRSSSSMRVQMPPRAASRSTTSRAT